MLIGIIGLREAASWKDSELEGSLAENASNGTAVAAAATDAQAASPKASKFQNSAIFVNGLLHGCSLDGLQTLAPALALASWRPALVFVLAHYIGTAISMSTFTAIVGEGSVRVGKALKKPDIVRNLS